MSFVARTARLGGLLCIFVLRVRPSTQGWREMMPLLCRVGGNDA